MARKGVYFEFGSPHFCDGVFYSLSSEDERFFSWFRSNRKTLAPILTKSAKLYLEKFYERETHGYPYFNIGEKGIIINIGDGARHIELWKHEPGIYFVSHHNLDSWIDRAVAFNVGSDLLETYYKNLLAPRICFGRNKWSLKYPLPDGVSRINHPWFRDENLKNIYEVATFGIPKIKNSAGLQKIVDSENRGELIIQNGFCEGINFQSWDVAQASFVISQLMSLTKEI